MIVGIKELERKLAALASETTANKIVRQALREGAKVIQAAAKQKVPKDTGFLKKSLKVRSGRRRKGRLTMLVGELDYRGDTFYGAMVEYGHGIGKRPAGMKHEKGATSPNDNRARVPARPFLRPAIDEKREQVEQQLATQIGRAIDQEMK